MAKILVVEDEAPNVEILQRLLSSRGYEVVIAGNKKDAVDRAAGGDIDLVLMDIGIPEEADGDFNKDGGLDATRLLKSNVETQSIPIIVTSASAMLDEKKRFLEAGCDDVQSKPYDFMTLLDAIKAQLS